MTPIDTGFSSHLMEQLGQNFQKSIAKKKKAPQALHKNPKWNLGVRALKGF
jgi:hypothetical protein